MNVESLLPFLLLAAPFLIAFIVEALVIYFFKLQLFWSSLGISIVINIVSIVLVYYVGGAILTNLGYQVGQFNGFNMPVQAIAFLWWFSTIMEGLMLRLFCAKQNKKNIYLAAIVMNLISFLFLYFFIANSH